MKKVRGRFILETQLFEMAVHLLTDPQILEFIDGFHKGSETTVAGHQEVIATIFANRKISRSQGKPLDFIHASTINRIRTTAQAFGYAGFITQSFQDPTRGLFNEGEAVADGAPPKDWQVAKDFGMRVNRTYD